VQTLVIDPMNPAILYVGCRGGLMKSEDGGATWKDAESGLGQPGTVVKVESLAIDATRPSIIYAGTWSGVFKSVDGGQSWTGPSGTSGASRHRIVNALALDPRQPSIVYAGLAGVVKSKDGGATWAAVNSGLPLVVP
jgi:photosystem II stability/assembly factor-like uncharacterized protein